MEKAKAKIYQDEWILTQCGRCYGGCAQRVHVINGVAVKIEGEPDSTKGAEGGICGKGAASLQVLYDPNRVNVPLRRTNPEKGLYADPKWKEISWEEAFDEIVPRLKKILSEDPGGVAFATSIMRDPHRGMGDMQFKVACGPMSMAGGGAGLHCGDGAHPSAGRVNASWSVVPDFKYCNYAIYIGSSKGLGSGHSAMVAARQAAEARARGMKVVSFDPGCHTSGGKATEWVPVIPGTDGAVILAMCNIIVNELGLWDAPYLRTKTNAPYLIGPDGRYVREKGPARGIKIGPSSHWDGKPIAGTYIGDDETNKPLVWDAVDNKSKVYDDPSIKEYALEGSYEVRGVKCQPAFQLVREHLKKYTPEMASEVSTVPVETIRRIATEFVQAASIGSTITIDGHNLPFRPASAIIFRGGQGHENSLHTCFAVSLLTQIVGAGGMPGGTIGWPASSLGYPGTGKLSWSPYKGIDGFIETDDFGPHGGLIGRHGPWPVEMPEITPITPEGVRSLAFAAMGSFYRSDRKETRRRIGGREGLEMMISWGCNVVLGVASPAIAAEALKEVPFIVVYELFNNEVTEGFADIVLPAASYLEESTVEGFLGTDYNHAFGMDDWCYHIVQPVVKPKGSRKQWHVFLAELADRLGITEKYVKEINASLVLTGDYQVKPTDVHSPEIVCDKIARNLFGDEHGWEWFKEHGFIRWPKKVEEAYWRHFIDARSPIYLEWLVDLREKAEELVKKTGLEDADLSQYTPLISWTPCSVHRIDDPQYDLYCFSYRDTLHTGSGTMEQPWLDEASRMNPFTYNITMNADTARRKGIKDGDKVEVESAYGRKVQGTVKVMEGQHLLMVGIAATAGHWAKGQPIARGKGTNFDTLLEHDRKHIDPVSGNIETSVRVKVRKI